MSKPPVAVVIGASRGMGRQIAIGLAEANYRVVVAAKSQSVPAALKSFPPDPNSSQSTITTVALEITRKGGICTPIAVDVRSTDSVNALFQKVIEQYGRIDVVVYNSGAIWWSSVQNAPFKRFKLMQEVNIEGLYSTVQASFPAFEAGGWNSRLIVVCPPIFSRFFRGKTAYAIGKVGMSVLVKGLAMDWIREGKKEMAVTGIWPAAAIESAATQKNGERDEETMANLRTPNVFSDAILAMLNTPADVVNGLLTTDEDFLREYHGVQDFAKYGLVPGAKPRRIMPQRFPDLTVAEQDDEGTRMDSSMARKSRSSKM